jgi:hypothetical protein
MKSLLRLYPTAWKVRHLEEVSLMLDDTKAGLSTAGLSGALDIIRGAVDAHLHPGPMGLPTGGVRRWLTADHLAGLCALLGGVGWLLAYAILAVGMVSLGEDGWREQRPLVLLAAAGPLGSVALVTLLARHRGDRLQLVLAMVGAVLSVAGAALLTFAIWAIVVEPGITFQSQGGAHVNPALVILLVGSLVGAFALGDARAVPRRWLGIMALGAIGLLYGLYSRADYPLPNIGGVAAGTAWVVGGLVYGIGWIGVGRALLRRRAPISSATAPAV